jgi:hypothetical protein
VSSYSIARLVDIGLEKLTRRRFALCGCAELGASQFSSGASAPKPLRLVDEDREGVKGSDASLPSSGDVSLGRLRCDGLGVGVALVDGVTDVLSNLDTNTGIVGALPAQTNKHTYTLRGALRAPLNPFGGG